MKDDLHSIVCCGNPGAHRVTDSDVFRSFTLDPAHHPRAFFQIDKHHIVRLLRRLGINDADSVNCTKSRGFHPFERLPLRSGKARGEISCTIDRVTLDEEPAISQCGAPMCFRRNNRALGHGNRIWRLQTCVNQAS